MSQDFEGNKYSKLASGNTNKMIVSRDFGGNKYSKLASDNTNKMIVSQDFAENNYSKNSRILCIINDKF